jgi:hypothetical protein
MKTNCKNLMVWQEYGGWLHDCRADCMVENEEGCLTCPLNCEGFTMKTCNCCGGKLVESIEGDVCEDCDAIYTGSGEFNSYHPSGVDILVRFGIGGWCYSVYDQTKAVTVDIPEEYGGGTDGGPYYVAPGTRCKTREDGLREANRIRAEYLVKEGRDKYGIYAYTLKVGIS